MNTKDIVEYENKERSIYMKDKLDWNIITFCVGMGILFLFMATPIIIAALIESSAISCG